MGIILVVLSDGKRHKQLLDLQGFLIDFPHNFMRDEDLDAQISDAAEYLVPKETFV